MKSDLKISFHKKNKKQKKTNLKSFPENLIRFFTPSPLRSTPGKSHAPRQVNLKLKLPPPASRYINKNLSIFSSILSRN